VKILNKDGKYVGKVDGVVYDAEDKQRGTFEYHYRLLDNDGKYMGHTANEWVYHADDHQDDFSTVIDI
jgi:hypothetical protein